MTKVQCIFNSYTTTTVYYIFFIVIKSAQIYTSQIMSYSYLLSFSHFFLDYEAAKKHWQLNNNTQN